MSIEGGITLWKLLEFIWVPLAGVGVWLFKRNVKTYDETQSQHHSDISELKSLMEKIREDHSKQNTRIAVIENTMVTQDKVSEIIDRETDKLAKRFDIGIDRLESKIDDYQRNLIQYFSQK